MLTSVGFYVVDFNIKTFAVRADAPNKAKRAKLEVVEKSLMITLNDC